MTGVRILIVDDEPNIASTLARTLEVVFAGDLEVIICKTAEIAFALLNTGSFDLLISDWHLPGMSGLSLILQSRKAFPDLKIVFMTASPIPELEEKVRLVADMYIHKPFKAHILAEQALQLVQSVS